MKEVMGCPKVWGFNFPTRPGKERRSCKYIATCILEENWSQTVQVLGPCELGTHW